MKKILTVFALTTIFLSCIALPCFADIENARQSVMANNSDLVYLDCDTRNILWFVDKTSIENRKDENGAKYWVVRVYLFNFYEWDGRGSCHIGAFGNIKDGQNVHNTLARVWRSYLIAVNKKQPQMQYLGERRYMSSWSGERASCDENSWPFNANRWEEFSEDTLNAEVYRYVKEHGGVLGPGTLGGKGVMIIIGAIIALGAIFVIKHKNSKYTGKIKDTGYIVQGAATNKSVDTVTDIEPKKQTVIAAEHKFCRKCGTKVDINAKFCPKCGEKF